MSEARAAEACMQWSRGLSCNFWEVMQQEQAARGLTPGDKVRLCSFTFLPRPAPNGLFWNEQEQRLEEDFGSRCLPQERAMTVALPPRHPAKPAPLRLGARNSRGLHQSSASSLLRVGRSEDDVFLHDMANHSLSPAPEG